MDIGCLGVPWECKFLAGQPGSFEGYASVFGVVDSHGDVVEPGAFAGCLIDRQRKGAGLPPMLKNHGLAGRDPIGVWDEMAEDSGGLHVRGRLVGLDTEAGRWTYAQMKEGALKGLSIGFKVRPYGSKMGGGRAGEPRRFLKAVDLIEVSPVDDPANPLARIAGIKMADLASALDARALEADLKRELKCSGPAAVRAVGIVKRHLRDADGFVPDTSRDDEEAASLAGALLRLAETMAPTRK